MSEGGLAPSSRESARQTFRWQSRFRRVTTGTKYGAPTEVGPLSLPPGLGMPSLRVRPTENPANMGFPTEADAGIRTPDPVITRKRQASQLFASVARDAGIHEGSEVRGA